MCADSYSDGRATGRTDAAAPGSSEAQTAETEGWGANIETEDRGPVCIPRTQRIHFSHIIFLLFFDNQGHKMVTV